MFARYFIVPTIFRDTSQECIFDKELGFRPSFYSEYGTMKNQYNFKKMPGVTRILFMGDSVTCRGKIIHYLRRFLGKKKYEYWNAAVESYNLIQEIIYFFKFNRRLNPDIVIIFFHPNDFEEDAVIFDQGKKIIYYCPGGPIKFINKFWFENSFLYRFLSCGFFRYNRNKKLLVSNSEKELSLLKNYLFNKGIDFKVVILPISQPYNEWQTEMKTNRRMAIKILDNLYIKYFDLLDVLSVAVNKNIVLAETPGDYWHPSEDFSFMIAKYLYKKGLIDEYCAPQKMLPSQK
jgi:hypothetical protein